MTILEQVVASSTKKSPATVRSYLGAVKAFLGFVGPAPLAWNGHNVERWRDHMARRGLAPETVNAYLSAVKFASRRLGELGQGQDFARAAEFVPMSRQKKRTAPGIDVAERMLATCAGTSARDLRDYALLTLGFRTGLRRESMVLLNLSDIEGAHLTCIIKGRRKHTLTVDPEVLAAMAPWVDWIKGRRGQGALFCAIRGATLTEPTKPGDRLHPSSVNYIVRRRATEAGVVLHPHLMRHCFISWAIASGVSLARVQGMTGHRDLSVLLGYVTDMDADSDPVGGHLPPMGRREVRR